MGGFHAVAFDDGEEMLLRARGKLKQVGAILPGDWVEVAQEGRDPVIERVLPRTSELVRPPVANVDLVVAVMALVSPPPVLELLDRILVRAEQEGLGAVIAFNKVDLADPAEVDALAAPYRRAGYPAVGTSAQTGAGIRELEEAVGTRLAVLSGPSGVGKSSLLNLLAPKPVQRTGEVSAKTQRGRHTTRAVSLFRLRTGGWMADAPGFSTLGLATVEPRAVREWFPEFVPLSGECRFTGCLHRQEPGCAVREAVEEGTIDRGRYERYLKLLAEMERAYERRYS